MRILSTLAIVACCSFSIPEPSVAQVGPKGSPAPAGGVISRITHEQLAGALSQAGYPSKVATQNNNKYVVSQMLGGINVISFMYGCTNQGCTSFDLTVFGSDQVNADFVNAWNNKKRFLRAIMDPSDGTLTLDAPIILSGGVTVENVKEHAKMFEAMLKEFANFQP
jgi:hypothetical protein